MEGKSVYFENVSRENRSEITETTLRIAKERAEELGIKTALVASTSGDTAVRAVEIFKGMQVVAVTQAAGTRQPNVLAFTEENRKIVESKGGAVVIANHPLSGINRQRKPADQRGGGPFLPHPLVTDAVDVISSTLGIFGSGTRVSCKIACMAADAGIVRTDEDVIAIAGSGGGANTAVVIRPANSFEFFNLRIKEILCKPHMAPLPRPLETAPVMMGAPNASNH